MAIEGSATEYIIRLVLKARDDMNLVLKNGARQVREYEDSARGLDDALEGVNKQITSMNDRATAATKKIAVMRENIDGLRKSVKEFVDGEDDLDEIIRRNVGHLDDQRDSTISKTAASRDAVASTRDQIRVQKELDAANETAKNKAVEAARAVNDNAAALKKHRAELTALLREDAGDDTIKLSPRKKGRNDQIASMRDDANVVKALDLSNKIDEATAAQRSLKSAAAEAKVSWDSASQSRKDFADTHKPTVDAIDDETEAISKNTEQQERNTRAVAAGHRARRQQVGAGRTDKNFPDNPSDELKKENTRLANQPNFLAAQKKRLTQEINADRRFLGSESRPIDVKRIDAPGFQGDPLVTERLRRRLAQRRELDQQIKDAKAEQAAFDPFEFERKVQASKTEATSKAAEIAAAKAAGEAELARIASQFETDETPSKAVEKREQTYVERDVPRIAPRRRDDEPNDDAIRKSDEVELVDLDDPDLFDDGFTAMGGRDRKRGGPVGRLTGEVKKAKDLRAEYQGATRALFSMVAAVKKGDATEEEWNIRLESTLKTLDRVSKGYAKFTELQGTAEKEIRKIIDLQHAVEGQAVPQAEDAIRKSKGSGKTLAEEQAEADERDRIFKQGAANQERYNQQSIRKRAQDYNRARDEAIREDRARDAAEATRKSRQYEQAESEDRRRTARQRAAGESEAERVERENSLLGAVTPVTRQTRDVVDNVVGKKKLTNDDVSSLNEQGAALSRLSSELKKASSNYDFGSDRSRAFSQAQRLVDRELREVNRRLTEHDGSVRKAQAQYPGLIGKLTQFHSAIQRNSDGLSTLDNKLQGLLVLAVLAFAEQLTSALISLGGSLGAVAASALEAGFALGGALAAGAAQAVPALALLIGAAARVKGVLDVVKQSDLVDEQKFQRANDTAKKVADTSDAVANAQDTLTSANESLANANDALSKSHEGVADALEGVDDAQAKLVDERKKAITNIRDLIQAERDAELAARGAALSQSEAQEALAKAVQSGDSNAIQEAENRVLEADQGVNRAQNSLDDARDGRRQAQRGVEAQDNVKDARKGVKDAKDNVVDARKAVEDAERGVVKAERSVEKARRGIDKARRGADAAAEDSFSAAEKLQYLLDQLSPAERRLYEAAIRLRETYKKNVGPITDIIIDAFARGLDTANELLQEPRILKSLKGLAEEIAEAMDAVRKEFSSGPVVDQMIRINDEGKKNLKPLTEIAINLGHAFLNIAEAAGPSLRRIFGYFDDLSKDIRDSTSNVGKLRDRFDRSTDSVLILFDAIKATINLIAALSDAGQDSGDTIFEDYTEYINGLAKSARENRGDVAKFFEDSRKGLYVLLPLLPALAKSLGEVFNPERMKPLVDFIIDTLLPALVDTMQIVSKLTTLIFKILDLPFVSDVTRWVIVLLLLNKTYRATGGLVETLFGSLTRMGMVLDKISKGGINTFLGNMTTALGGLIKKIPGLERVGRALEGVGDSAKRAAAKSRAAGTVGNTPVIRNPMTGEVMNPGAGGAEAEARAGMSKRGMAMRGLGAAALIGGGAYAMSQQSAQGLRQAAGLNTGSTRQMANVGLGQLGGALGQLTSFDFNGLGGSIKGMFKGSEPLIKFSKDFNKQLDTLTKRRDQKGLKDLADRARDLATQYPKYSDALKEAAQQADNNADSTKKQKEQLKDIEPVVKRLARRGIVLDLRTKLRLDKNLAEDIDYYLDNLRKGIPRSLGALRRDVKAQIERIQEAFAPGNVRTDAWYDSMVKTNEAGISNLRRLRREGKISQEQFNDSVKSMRHQIRLLRADTTDEGNSIGKSFARSIRDGKGDRQKAIESVVADLDKMPIAGRRQAAAMAIDMVHQMEKDRPEMRGAAKRLSAEVGTRWRSMRDINVKRAGQMVDGSVTAIGEMPGLVRRGIKDVTNFVNQGLGIFGAKPVKAELSPFERITSQVTSLVSNLFGGGENDATGGVVGRGAARYSVAGVVGNEGERGKDDIPAWIGRGEMVLNAAHQRYIQPAVEAFYGHPLGKTFQRIRGFHRGGYQDGFTGFSGGFAGKSPAGLKTVPIPGFPGEFIAQRVVKDAVGLAKKFSMTITDAFATAGHTGKGHLFYGTAMDTVPGKGGSWDRVNQAVRYATNKGITVLYDGRFGSRAWPDHGEGHHAHFELQPGKTASGAGGDDTQTTGVPKKIKVPAFKVRARGAQQRLIQRALDQIQKGAQSKLNSAWEKAADAAYKGSGNTDVSGSTDYPDGKLSEAKVHQLVRQAMGMRGIKTMRGLWEKMLVRQAYRESGFDPGNQNRSAAGVAAGNPKGLMQVVTGTFNANKYPGHNNPFNPLDSLLASIKYIIGRYGRGNKDRAAQVMWDRGGGAYASGGIVRQILSSLPPFARGGEIEGTTGTPTPILAHAGEWVLNPGQQKKMARMLGVTRDVLKAAMGFAGNNKSAAGGTEISDTETATDRAYSSRAEALRRKAARGGIYDLPTIDAIESMSDALTEISRATKALKNSGKSVVTRIQAIKNAVKEITAAAGGADKLSSKEQREIKELQRERELLEKGIGKTPAARRRSRRNARAEARRDEIYNTVNEVSKEGGLFDQASTQRDRESGRRARAAIFRRFRRGAGGTLVERGGADREVEAAATAVDDARDNLKNIEEQRKLITDAMAKTKSRLAKLKKGGITAAESAEARKLQGQLGVLRGQFDTIRDAEAEAQSGVFDAQVTAQQAVVDSINKRADKKTNANDIAKRFATAVGRDDLVTAINDAQLENLRKQAADLGPEIAKARKMGNNALADQLEDQVNDINATIFEGVQQSVRDATDAVNKSFDRRNRAIDLKKRVASALGDKGALASLDVESRQSAIDQVGELSKKLKDAQNVGNTGLAQEIQDQIDDINTSIVEMTAQSFRTAVDQINEAAQDGMARADLMDGAADAFGKLGLDGTAVFNGETMSRRAAFAQRDRTMQTQRGDLSNTLMQVMLTQPGNVGLIKELTDQIRGIDLSIQQNSKALFDARVDDVNARTQRQTSLMDLDAQILSLKGEISGVTDNAGLLDIAGRRQNTLDQQRTDLQALLVDAIAQGNEEGVQNLTEQLKQNEIASLENTKTIRDLTGATLQPQTYSSAYWREFREALYDGMGNVLPQYDISAKQTSGAMDKSGVFRANASADPITPDYVANGNMGQTINEGDTNIEINEAGGDIDETRLAATIAFAKKTIQR